MNSRERILLALDHKEPDRVPYDLAGSTWTGITNVAYQKLLKHLNLPSEEPVWADVIQQIVVPSPLVLDLLKVDTRGLLPLTSHNWDIYSQLKDAGDYLQYEDEWNFTHHFPKNDGHWFSLVKNPMAHLEDPSESDIIEFKWPYAADKRRVAGLREKALQYRDMGKLVVIKGLCAGVFEMHQRVRGMSNALMDSFMCPEFSDLLIGKIADLKIEFWEMALNELGDVVDVVAEGDDYGTQESQLISPEHFRDYYKPHMGRVLQAMRRKAPGAKVMFHSCGNVRPIIPDFIEMGVDILNPVHITAAGMEADLLKKDFGRDIVFWGGGIDTQKILPSGSPSEVADSVRRNIDHLAPGGGFVFTTVHNIQSEVPPGNIMVMLETLDKYGKY
ncbi:MAG: uroporphyrinogen decarboxylase family protein [Prolixibacteraceae bacterium]